jgi:hypothetical protein
MMLVILSAQTFAAGHAEKHVDSLFFTELFAQFEKISQVFVAPVHTKGSRRGVRSAAALPAYMAIVSIDKALSARGCSRQ